MLSHPNAVTPIPVPGVGEGPDVPLSPPHCGPFYLKFYICFFFFPFFYSRWIVDMEGAPGTLYEGEKFQLLFKFSSRYPFDSPQVNCLAF